MDVVGIIRVVIMCWLMVTGGTGVGGGGGCLELASAAGVSA